MPAPPQRNLPIGPGGVAAELGTMDPRVARRRATPTQGHPRPGADAPPPPQNGPTAANEFVGRMALRRRPGKRGKGTGRVRMGHEVVIDGAVAFCHSFTITRMAYDALRSGEALSSQGATTPDGLPIEPGSAVRCASCGSEQVGCREILFYED